jgi:hypothetical protein
MVIMRTFSAIISLLLLFVLVAAQDDRATDPLNHFKYQGPAGLKYNTDQTVYWQNQNWTVGQNQPITWVANFNVGLALYQEGAGPNIGSVFLSSE